MAKQDFGGCSNGSFIVQELRYHIMQFGQRFEIPAEMIEVKELLPQMGRGIAMDITARVYGRDIDQIKFPMNWKESLKDRFLPKWLQKKFPVKYMILKVSALLPKRAIKEESIVLRVVGPVVEGKEDVR